MSARQVKELVPRFFFVTSGKGVSPVSKLNAFDKALKDAGIHDCNLVPVSSIIPPNAQEISPIPLTPGSIVFVVMSKMEGEEGETISAGIAWGFGVDENGKRVCGYVVEAHGNENSTNIEKKLADMIEEMADIRGVKLENVKMKIETIRVPAGSYGCVIAALVLLL